MFPSMTKQKQNRHPIRPPRPVPLCFTSSQKCSCRPSRVCRCNRRFPGRRSSGCAAALGPAPKLARHSTSPARGAPGTFRLCRSSGNRQCAETATIPHRGPSHSQIQAVLENSRILDWWMEMSPTVSLGHPANTNPAAHRPDPVL